MLDDLQSRLDRVAFWLRIEEWLLLGLGLAILDYGRADELPFDTCFDGDCLGLRFGDVFADDQLANFERRVSARRSWTPRWLKLFDQIRIEDDDIREWFLMVLKSKTSDEQEETKSQRAEFRRQLALLETQQDRLVSMRVDDEIDADLFAKKQTELRDKKAKLELRLAASDRSHDEQSDLAVKALELSQTLAEKWVAADCETKRRILEFVCLNLELDGATLCVQMRKPFDSLADGRAVPSSRGDRT